MNDPHYVCTRKLSYHIYNQRIHSCVILMNIMYRKQLIKLSPEVSNPVRHLLEKMLNGYPKIFGRFLRSILPIKVTHFFVNYDKRSPFLFICFQFLNLKCNESCFNFFQSFLSCDNQLIYGSFF